MNNERSHVRDTFLSGGARASELRIHGPLQNSGPGARSRGHNSESTVEQLARQGQLLVLECFQCLVGLNLPDGSWTPDRSRDLLVVRYGLGISFSDESHTLAKDRETSICTVLEFFTRQYK